MRNVVLAVCLGVVVQGAAAEGEQRPEVASGFRGVFFNPNIPHPQMAGYPWPVFDPYGTEYRRSIRQALADLASEARINLVDLFLPIPFTLAHPLQAPRPGQPLREWANLRYLDNVARFVDDCHAAGIAVQFDLVDNRWVPFEVDSEHHIGRPGNPCWPVADADSWQSSATWYAEIIAYIEAHARHPEAIALWSMMGNYQHGAAEPCLWDDDRQPAILRHTERYVKKVWPAFRAAGKRPKGAPYTLPIFSGNAYWKTKTPDDRLAGFIHLKKWLVDDLALPPDYWPMSVYPYCDPAPDGFHYLRRIVEILGPTQASRILATDLKGPGHEDELKDSILAVAGHAGPDTLQWHFEKCRQYGFAGWWIWAYQDQATSTSGLRRRDGTWKPELLRAVRQQAGGQVWSSQPPKDCPLERSKTLVGVEFTGRHSDYHCGDTWYPCWASDGNLYSPWTDGRTDGIDGNSSGEKATTGNAVMIGDDPLGLVIRNTAPPQPASPRPYEGRYPCGSLVHNGIWYYGTYCLGPSGSVKHDGFTYNWPVLGPMPGFRISRDYGKTWTASPLSPDKPLFPEPARFMGSVKMGCPHFVDFGRNMEHSPDGKAYLLGMGAEENDPKPRYANLSWISADQAYLARVTPSPETINDVSQYEFFAGHDAQGRPVWSGDFARIKPLLEWNNHMGCVTATYDPGLKKYLMCVTDGWPTCAKMGSYILEADQLTGPWRLVVYLKDFGEQGYFLNFPSKFIGADGRTLWLCYSANFAPDWNGEKLQINPPGGRYGLCLHELRLLAPGEKP